MEIEFLALLNSNIGTTMYTYPTNDLINNVASLLNELLTNNRDLNFLTKRNFSIDVCKSKFSTPSVNIETSTITITETFAASLWCEMFSMFTIYEEGYLKPAKAGHFSGHLDTGNPLIQQAIMANNYATALICAPLPWQSYIPTPHEELPESNEYQPSKINNLFVKALAFILLHEVAHIVLKHNPLMEARTEMENDADTYAIETILSIEDDKEKLLYFISLAIALSTQIKVNKKSLLQTKTLTHPNVSSRIDRLVTIGSQSIKTNTAYIKSITCFLYSATLQLLDIFTARDIQGIYNDEDELYSHILRTIDSIITP